MTIVRLEYQRRLMTELRNSTGLLCSHSIAAFGVFSRGHLSWKQILNLEILPQERYRVEYVPVILI